MSACTGQPDAEAARHDEKPALHTGRPSVVTTRMRSRGIGPVGRPANAVPWLWIVGGTPILVRDEARSAPLLRLRLRLRRVPAVGV